MSKYYDWAKTLSYNADVTMVISARGFGKTYGLRKQVIIDYIKHGWRFVEIVRFKNELSDVSDGYFSRVGKEEEFKNYMFKTDSRYAYIADAITDDDLDVTGKKVKPEWHVIGYFVALSEAQKKKKKTYDSVRRLIFDEAIIEKSDRYHNYLPNEYGILAGLVDTVSRERKDVNGVKPRLYLLANACDLVNPYFIRYGVTADISFGYRWYDNKTFLLHYVEPGEYGEEKSDNTVAGRMLKGTVEGKVAAMNEFVIPQSDFVHKKPGRAKFQFGIAFNNKIYGIWVDYTEGYYYVSYKIPNNTDKPILALTVADSRVNYINANKFNRILKQFAEIYWYGIVRYESAEIQTEFCSVLSLFGVR